MDESALCKLTSDWPGVQAGMKWEDDLVFTVAGKMFCVTCVTCVTCVRGLHAGSMSFKVEDERLELTERPGFIPARYLARAHWGDGRRLREALKRIACLPERPAVDGRAGASHQGRLLANKLDSRCENPS